MHLGRISGIEVLKRIKAINPDAKVLIITGSISSDNQSKDLKYSETDYIQKPIDLADFKKKVFTYI